MSCPNVNKVEEGCAAEWACLEAHLPGRCAHEIGILLLENGSNSLDVKIQQNWWLGIVDREEEELWEALSADLREKALMMSGRAFFEWLQDSCSHAIRLGPLQSIEVEQMETTLARIQGKFVTAPEAGEHMSDVAGELSALRPKYHSRVTPVPVSRNVWRLSGSWIAQGAMAATLLLGAALAGHYSRLPTMNGNYKRIVSPEIQLPVTSDYYYRTVHLEVGQVVESHSARHPRRRKHTHPAVIRKFVVPDVSPYRSSEVALLEAPSCCEASAEADESTPSFLQFEPELPEYHPRHGRVVRILAAAATPFRLLALR